MTSSGTRLAALAGELRAAMVATDAAETASRINAMMQRRLHRSGQDRRVPKPPSNLSRKCRANAEWFEYQQKQAADAASL
jgi:hypothetical protein